MAQVITGVVFPEFTQAIPDGAICQHGLQAQYLIAHVAIAKHIDSTGIGREIAADLATSFGAQTQGKKSIGVQGRLLNIRQDTAGFDRDRVIDWVDTDDSIHTPQVENNLPGLRYRTST